MNIFRKITLYILITIWILFEEIIYNKIIKPSVDLITRYVTKETIIRLTGNLSVTELVITFSILFMLSEIIGVMSFGFLVNSSYITFIALYSFKTIIAVIAFTILKENKETMLTNAIFYKLYSSAIQIIDYIQSSSYYIKIVSLRKVINISHIKNAYSYIYHKIKGIIK